MICRGSTVDGSGVVAVAVVLSPAAAVAVSSPAVAMKVVLPAPRTALPLMLNA